MASVDIGIGHNHNLVVAKLRQVHCLRIFFSTDGNAQSSVDIADLLAFESAVLHSLLHIEDLTAKRKDGLESTVTAYLGSTAGGITLDEEEFALGRILVGAVSQLAGKSAAAHDGLALHELTSLAGGVAGSGGQYHLLHYQLGIPGILFKICLESSGSSCRHGTHHLAVAKFGLGLTLELRLGHLH